MNEKHTISTNFKRERGETKIKSNFLSPITKISQQSDQLEQLRGYTVRSQLDENLIYGIFEGEYKVQGGAQYGPVAEESFAVLNVSNKSTEVQ